MTLADLIYQETKTLPDQQAREVLDFIGYLKHKSGMAEISASLPQVDESSSDWAEFEGQASAWSGKFNRDECYDRPVLR